MKKITMMSGLLLFAGLQANAQFANSSLERYNYQIGDGTLEVRSYDGFDEFEDVASLAGFKQYDFRVNSGAWETITLNSEGIHKRGIQYATLGDMLAARPNDGTYEHRVTWNDDSTSTITLAGPRDSFASEIPNDPVFTIGGITGGAWSRNTFGEPTGVLTFNPTQFADGQSFTVTMNAYSGPTDGAGQASSVFVADISSGFTSLDDFALVNVPKFSENDDVTQQIALTFTKGAGPIDAGDSDPLTYMFDNTSRFELEGEHVNLYTLDDAGTELGLGNPDDAVKGFIYQTVTNVIIVADPSHVPEPGSLALLGLGALTVLRRRR